MSDSHFDSWRAICSLKARYFRFVDDKRWDDLTALFTENATFHYPVFGRAMQRPEAISSLRAATIGVESIHTGSLPDITFESADRASAIWNMEDRLYTASASTVDHYDLTHGFGRYHERYERHDGTWLISRLELQRLHKDRYVDIESTGAESS